MRKEDYEKKTIERLKQILKGDVPKCPIFATYQEEEKKQVPMEFNEYYQKKAYITQLSYALSIDGNSMVDSITYTYNPDAGDEVIVIVFKGGSIKKILVTGNSNGQNAREIVEAVYG